jgi:heme-degrading monooxygenase HmoA
MILEVADIRIKTGQQTEFEAAVQTALKTVFPKAKGFCDHNFHRCIESPDRYVLQLTWETLEDHTVKFRGSPLFAEWRAMVGDFFAQPPYVEHFELVSTPKTK